MNVRTARLTYIVLCSVLVVGVCAQPSSNRAVDGQWARLQKIYSYPVKAVEVQEVSVQNSDCRAERITFVGPEGDEVKGFFFRPREDGVYPVVLALHGATDSAHGPLVTDLSKAFTMAGVSVLALDAPHHGDRMSPDDQKALSSIVAALSKSKLKGDVLAQIYETDQDGIGDAFLTSTIRQGVKDYRRALDWLATRKDVRADRIGVFGYSLGSIMSSILIGVDSRLHSAALCVAGDPILPLLNSTTRDLEEHLLTISCSLYIPHAAGRPVLMLNGWTDQEMPKSATDRLYSALSQPKEIRWFDSGHSLPPQALHEAAAWSVKQLKG